MKKSFLSSLLLGVFFVTSIGMLTSCKDYDDDISTNTSAITKLQEQVTTLKSALDQAQRQFGIRICLEKFQLPSLFNAHGQCLGLILEETVCSQCRTEIHEEVMYGAMA